MNTRPDINILASNGFVMVIDGMEESTFMLNRCTLPGLTLGTAEVATPYDINYTQPGDKILFDDLVISFIIDENLNNWIEIWKWCRAAAKNPDVYKDITIHSLTNKKNFNRTFRYTGCYPYNLSGISFDYAIPPDAPLQGDVTFKFIDVEIS